MGPVPAHGARGVVGGDVVALGCVLLGAAHEARPLGGQPAALLERVCRVQVHHEHREQPDSHDPQQQRAGQQPAAEVAQRLGVFVHPRGALVQVQVADHVNDHEAQQPDAGPGHDPLAADRRLVDVQRERQRGAWPVNTGADPAACVAVGAMYSSRAWRGAAISAVRPGEGADRARAVRYLQIPCERRGFAALRRRSPEEVQVARDQISQRRSGGSTGRVGSAACMALAMVR